MKITIFGATGYVGQRVSAALLAKNHQVIAFARTPQKLVFQHPNLQVVQGDLWDKNTLEKLPKDIDAAYFLVHSLSQTNFEEKEKKAGENFLGYIHTTSAKQIIFLSGIINDAVLSPHLRSRKKIEDLLRSSSIPSTILRAGIILGSESASYLILRDLVEKLPFMVAPRWIDNKLQPISIFDTVGYLLDVLGNEKTYHQIYDIASDEVLSYKELMLLYAKLRGLKRLILTVPILTPRLSSYWLYFVTAQDFFLARSLIDSLKNDFLSKNDAIKALFPKKLFSVEKSLKKILAPLDEEAEYYFSQQGKLPPDAYLLKESEKVPRKGAWESLYTKNGKEVFYKRSSLGEYWFLQEEKKEQMFFRPKGILGRLLPKIF